MKLAGTLLRKLKDRTKEKTMDLGLEGKVALITGAGSQKGFGKGIALILAKEGCDIIVNDIDLEGAKKQRLRSSL